MIDQIISLGNNKNIVALELAGEIVDLDYPSQVEPNSSFDISYGVKNISTTSYAFFGHLEDEIDIIPGTEWQTNIEPNDTYYPPIFTHQGLAEPAALTLTLGHVEEEVPPPEVPWELLIATVIGTGLVVVAVVINKKKKK